MKYTFYIFYNVLYQLFLFWLLLLVGTYYNGVIISSILFWKSPKESADLSQSELVKALFLLLEAAILLLLIYIANQLILSDSEIKARRISIANRTALVNTILTVIFLALMIFSS
jgi:hypothetical protein